MVARPSFLVLTLALGGAVILLVARGNLPDAHYAPAALGAASVFFTSLSVNRELRLRERFWLSVAAAVLGFLVGAALARPPFRWSFGFAGAFLPLYVGILAGIGRERLTFELARLEDLCDDPKTRQAALARAIVIRDDSRQAALAIDPKGDTEPHHAGDSRAIYAFAAQVVAYAKALDQQYDEALASLTAVPRRWMPQSMRALMQANIVFWLLCKNDVAEAQKAFDEIVEQDALVEVRPVVRVTRAVMLVHGGRFDEALEIVGKDDGEVGEPEIVRGRHRMVRAHVFAAKDDLDGARAEIARIVDVPAELDEMAEWLPAGGPAVDLMKEAVEKAGRGAKGQGVSETTLPATSRSTAS